jgi:hypothetical protein
MTAGAAMASSAAMFHKSHLLIAIRGIRDQELDE